MLRRPPRSTRTDTLFPRHDALPICLERESSKLPEHERVIERAPVFGLSNDIEQNQISVRMLGRSERERNEPSPALGPWMIWTASLATRTRPPCRQRALQHPPEATQTLGTISPLRLGTCVARRA